MQKTKHFGDPRQSQPENQSSIPDHLAGAEHGDLENGVISFTYNPAGDLVLKTDQAGDSCETVLNLAGVVTTRLFREHANTPNGMPNDTHTFVLDDAGRIVSASTSRFENTVTWEYDAAGRKSKESLTLGLAENSQSYAVSRTFDKRGQTRSLIYPDQNLVERTYTKQGWIDTISYDEKPIHTRSYDDGGRLLTSTFGNGVETSYSYRVDNQTKTTSSTRSRSAITQPPSIHSATRTMKTKT